MRQTVASLRIVTILVAAAIGATLMSACRATGQRAPGATSWEIDSSPAIGADGTVYFGSDDANLYAVGGARR